MRFLIAIMMLGAVHFPSPPASADQNDPQLDGLFRQLHDAPNVSDARRIERRIWILWTRHDDAAVNGLMRTGLGQMERRDYVAALDTFAAMVDLAPEFAEAWNKRATVHWLLGHYQDSLSDIERTLTLEPRHFGALSGRGLVYIGLEQWDLALEAFEGALEVYPQMVGPRVNSEAIHRLREGRAI